jgi:hypothetical protein
VGEGVFWALPPPPQELIPKAPMNTNTANAGLYLLPKPAKTIAATPASVSGQPRSCGVRKLALVVVVTATVNGTAVVSENGRVLGLTLQVMAAEGDWQVSATSPLNLTSGRLATRCMLKRAF